MKKHSQKVLLPVLLMLTSMQSMANDNAPKQQEASLIKTFFQTIAPGGTRQGPPRSP